MQQQKIIGGQDIVQHHYIYDDSDRSKYTVGMTRSDHAGMHNRLTKLGYVIPHINIKKMQIWNPIENCWLICNVKTGEEIDRSEESVDDIEIFSQLELQGVVRTNEIRIWDVFTERWIVVDTKKGIVKRIVQSEELKELENMCIWRYNGQ